MQEGFNTITLADPIPIEGETLTLSDSLYSPTYFALYTATESGHTHAVINDTDSEYPLHKVDLTEDRYLTGIGRSGNGPGEFKIVASIEYEQQSHRLRIVDTKQKRITFLDPTLTARELQNLHQQEPSVVTYNFGGLIMDLLSLRDGTYLSVGPIRSEKGHRFAKLDSAGQVLEYYGQLPDRNWQIPPLKRQLSWRAYGTSSLEQGAFAVGYYFQSRIEIYDHEGHLLHTTIGPDYADFTFEDSGGSLWLSSDTKRAYIDITHAGDRIYALYSGGGSSEKGSNFGSYIFVLNWEGDLLTQHQTDRRSSLFG